MNLFFFSISAVNYLHDCYVWRYISDITKILITACQNCYRSNWPKKSNSDEWKEGRGCLTGFQEDINLFHQESSLL